MNDSFGRQIDYLRLSVTDRCNLRCIYCMPDEGVQLVEHSDLLSFEEIERLALVFRSLGIRKVRVTGGEPLLRRGLPDLVRRIGEIGFDEIVLTTNGILLPEMAADLRKAGVSRVNISLDSLRDEKLAAICRGSASVEAVEAAIRSATTAGLVPVRINCVVLRGLNDSEIPDLIVWAAGEGVQVRFIEHMPASLGRVSFVPAGEIVRRASSLGTAVEKPHTPGEVQRSFFIEGTEFAFGVISPLTGMDFCERCRRVRLSATGRLLTCLSRADGIDLRAAMRSGADEDSLRLSIRQAISEKPLRHDGCQGMKMWRTGG
jgi:cyclic pyranopterin phosphate synthase